MSVNHKVTDYNHISSTVGNAFFSGVSYQELWSCINESETKEELDAAVNATIKLNELTQKKE